MPRKPSAIALSLGIFLAIGLVGNSDARYRRKEPVLFPQDDGACQPKERARIEGLSLEQLRQEVFEKGFDYTGTRDVLEARRLIMARCKPADRFAKMTVGVPWPCDGPDLTCVRGEPERF